MTRLEDVLADQLTLHTPGSRAFCRKAAAQIAPALAPCDEVRAERRLALLRLVVTFVDMNRGDLPLPLLEAIRVETGDA